MALGLLARSPRQEAEKAAPLRRVTSVLQEAAAAAMLGSAR